MNVKRPQFGRRPLQPIYHCLPALCAVLCLFATPTLAAEKVLFRYGPAARSIPVNDLREFADTGKSTRKLRSYLKLSRQDPDKVQDILTKPVAIDPLKLDRLLNSSLGNVLLDEVGEVIHTPADRANRQALRSALILDASVDQQITLIDTLEEYPTSQVEVEGERLVSVIQKFNRIKAYGEDAQPIVQGVVETVLGEEAQPFLDDLLERIGSFLE